VRQFDTADDLHDFVAGRVDYVDGIRGAVGDVDARRADCGTQPEGGAFARAPRTHSARASQSEIILRGGTGGPPEWKASPASFPAPGDEARGGLRTRIAGNDQVNGALEILPRLFRRFPRGRRFRGGNFLQVEDAICFAGDRP